MVENDTTYLTETTCDSQLAGQEEDLFQSQFGCDSLVITTISLLASDTTYQTIKKCEVSTIGMDTLFLTNSNGCDSLLITETILEDRRDIERLTASTCSIAQVGFDTLTLKNRAGCDSLVITEFMLLSSDTTRLQNFNCCLLYTSDAADE